MVCDEINKEHASIGVAETDPRCRSNRARLCMKEHDSVLAVLEERYPRRPAQRAEAQAHREGRTHIRTESGPVSGPGSGPGYAAPDSVRIPEPLRARPESIRSGSVYGPGTDPDLGHGPDIRTQEYGRYPLASTTAFAARSRLRLPRARRLWLASAAGSPRRSPIHLRRGRHHLSVAVAGRRRQRSPRRSWCLRWRFSSSSPT